MSNNKQKHVFSIQGREIHERSESRCRIRRRSSEELEENKRHHTEEQIAVQEIPGTSKMGSEEDFTKKMIAALSNATVRQLVVTACDESNVKFQEKTEKRMDEIEMKGGEMRDIRMDNMDARIDRFEQKEKENKKLGFHIPLHK